MLQTKYSPEIKLQLVYKERKLIYRKTVWIFGVLHVMFLWEDYEYTFW